MNDNNWLVLFYVFLLTSFFSTMSWLNSRVKSDAYVEGSTSTRVKVEGFTHSMISSLIAVVAFACLNHFYPEWELMLQGSASVTCGALLGETLIKFAERRINNDKLI